MPVRMWSGHTFGGDFEGASVPCFVCDYCEELIRSVEDGVVILDIRADDESGQPYECWFAHHDQRHMDRCHRRLESELESKRGSALGWIELSDFLNRMRAAFPSSNGPH